MVALHFDVKLCVDPTMMMNIKLCVDPTMMMNI